MVGIDSAGRCLYAPRYRMVPAGIFTAGMVLRAGRILGDASVPCAPYDGDGTVCDSGAVDWDSGGGATFGVPPADGGYQRRP